jgi:hypothetical protein
MRFITRAAVRILAVTGAVSLMGVFDGLLNPAAAAETAPFELGVGLTPAHAPNQSGEDVAEMYRLAGELGKFAALNFSWSDPGMGRVSEQMLQLAGQFGLQPIVQLDILEQGGFRLLPPPDISASRLEGKAFDAYASTVRRLATQQPEYLGIATDINRLLALGPDHLADYAKVYKHVYDIAKEASPKTKIFVSFNWDIFKSASDSQGVPLSELGKLIDLFRPKLDLLALTSIPVDRFKTPADIPAGYYQGIAELGGRKDVLLQVGWTSAGSGGEAAQAAFVDRLPALLGGLNSKILVWPILHDIPAGDSPLTSLGLYTTNGQPKPAAERFRLLGGRALTKAPDQKRIGADVTPQREASRREASDKFAIYSSALAGDGQSLIASDPDREINHAHLSPDRSHVAFTRYNVRNSDGVALETNSYFQTEIMVCDANGNECEVVIPPRPGIVAANASWTPDGWGLLFVTNDTPPRRPGVSLYDLATGRITLFYQPDKINVADPHVVGQMMVSPGVPTSGEKISKLYLINLPSDATQLARSSKSAAPAAKAARVLTSPKYANFTTMDPALGDYDPKLSPDGKKVAVMRHLAQDDWAIVIVDVATGEETNLSGPRPVDAVPEWSSDGKLLIFWHVNRADLKQSGIYTMRPDGSERTRVPLPPGYFYTMPAFVPGGGSDPSSKIIYSAQRKKGM